MDPTGADGVHADFSFLQIHRPPARERSHAALVALYTLDAGLPLDATIEAFRMINPPSGQRQSLLHREQQPFTLMSKIGS